MLDFLFGFWNRLFGGKIWYVTATDSGGTGTGAKDDPWQTFDNVDETVISPGDTITGMNEDHTGQGTWAFRKAGESGKLITIKDFEIDKIYSTQDYIKIKNCTADELELRGDYTQLVFNIGLMINYGNNSLVRGNNGKIYDTLSDGTLFENNYFNGAVTSRPIRLVGSKNFIFRYNFYNTTGGYYGIYIRNEAIGKIYGNVIHNDNHAILGDDSDIDVYNNIFISTNGRGISLLNTTGARIWAVKNNICSGTTQDVYFSNSGSALTVNGGYNCLENDSAVTTSGTLTYNGSSNDLYATDPKLTPTYRLYPDSPCLDAGIEAITTEITVSQAVTPASSWPDSVSLEDYEVNIIDDDFASGGVINFHNVHIGPWSDSSTT